MRKAYFGLLLGPLFWLAACSPQQDKAITQSADSMPSADTVARSSVDAADLAAQPVDSLADTPEAKKPSAVAPRQMTGKFQELVEGDYLHFELRDDADGKQKSFFLAEDIPQKEWMPFYEHPEYKGKKVKITWRNTDRYLEHAGAVNNIDEVLSIELMK